MNRRNFLSTTTSSLAASSIIPRHSFADDNVQDLPKPSTQQVAWQDCELGMFFHFDIPVFKPGWDWRSWKDLPDPKLYDPKKLDTDQWLQAASSLGAKYAVLVAKHCSGFLQWQSDLYPYGVRQSPWRGGKGDLVRDFVKSCERFNIKPGIYASVTANGYLEVDNPGLVNRGRGGDPAKQAAYSRICEGMLSELWGGMATSSISGLTGVLCHPTKVDPTCCRCFTSFSHTPTSSRDRQPRCGGWATRTA